MPNLTHFSVASNKLYNIPSQLLSRCSFRGNCRFKGLEIYFTIIAYIPSMLYIPHICHFLYTDRIFENQILHPKKRLKAPKTLQMSLKKSNICIFFHSIWKNLHLTEIFYTGTACGACDKYEVCNQNGATWERTLLNTLMMTRNKITKRDIRPGITCQEK